VTRHAAERITRSMIDGDGSAVGPQDLRNLNEIAA
jgi:hypothetical protein